MYAPRSAAAAVILAVLLAVASGCQGGPGSGGTGTGGSTPGGSSGGGTPPGAIYVDGASTTPPPTPALAGHRVVISPGHGYYYHSTLGWTTQRGLVNGLIEDIHTNEIAMDYVLPYLEGAGALVFSCRDRSRQEREVILDQDTAGAAYAEAGTWTTTATVGLGYGGSGYRYAATAATETARATFRAAIPESGAYPVWIWYVASTNRVPDCRIEVEHSGGTSAVVIDQTQDGSRWRYLGTWYFEAGGPASVAISNASSYTGVVIADAVRFGSGIGDIDRGGGPSYRPRWQEAARYWTQVVGAPSWVYDATTGDDHTDDVTCRAQYANWQGGEAYLSIHTNAGGGTGTSSYIHDTNPSPGSSQLQSSVHTQLISDIRGAWDAGWRDRGELSANFGEVRETRVMPAVLVEIAFHDLAYPDAYYLANDRFRHLAGRALYKGITRYLVPGAAISPLPPERVRATYAGPYAVEVGWEPAVDPLEGNLAAPAGYLVHLSRNGFGFDDGVYTTRTRVTYRNLTPGQVYFFRVTAVSAGGRSLPSEVVAARLAPAGGAPRVLVALGFDRIDPDVTVRGGMNTGDQVIEHALGIAAAAGGTIGFDSASNEAVVTGSVALSAYAAVDWVTGLETTDDETFSDAEQSIVSAYLAAGGSLLASGAEIAWDLDYQGTATDQAFLHTWLHASYATDDAGGATEVGGSGGTFFAGLPQAVFGTGAGRSYPVDYPDSFDPTSGGFSALEYPGTAYHAAIAYDGTHRTLLVGFPIETVADAASRQALIDRSVRYLLRLP